MKDYNNLFGKSYSTRPGGSLSDKCPHDITKFNKPPRTPRDLTEQHRIRRPGSVVQPPSVHVIDFDMMKANDILKYGTKVHIDDRQLEHTYEDENGQLQTKKLAELSFDVSTKLSELQKITALGSNVPLDDKLNLLNTMIQEISGKFTKLTRPDMKNISKITDYMGDELKNPSDIDMPDYLTLSGFAKELLDDNGERLTLWLAKQSTNFGYMASHGVSNTKIYESNKLAQFMAETPKALYNLKSLEITLKDWDGVGGDMRKPKNSGKRIDYFEYDAHPRTKENIDNKEEKQEKKQEQEQKRERISAEKLNKAIERVERKEQKEKEVKETKEAKEVKTKNTDTFKKAIEKQEQKKQRERKEQKKEQKKEQDSKEERILDLASLATDIRTAKAYIAKVKKRMGKPPTDSGRRELKKANEILDKLMEQKNNI
jgi:hypothetical protein